MLRKYLGREIGPAIVAAVEAVPKGHEIVTFKAGENMPITCAFIEEGADTAFIPEHAWHGESWNEIGYL